MRCWPSRSQPGSLMWLGLILNNLLIGNVVVVMVVSEEVVVDNTSRTSSTEMNHGSCNLYIAKSTIEQAGLGVFTAVALKKGDHVGNGDVCIPIKDIEWQQVDDSSQKFVNPFADYVWLGDPLGLKPEIGPYQLISAYWPGVNAATNCHPAMLNVDRATPRYDNFDATLHRSSDATVGSFTPYFNGSSTVTHAIPPGGELFTSYGDRWFEGRLKMFPLNFPVPSSYRLAQRFLHRFKRHVPSQKAQQLVYDFVLNAWRDDIWKDSRLFQALPDDLRGVDLALKEGLRALFQQNSTRSIDWLRENGACLDNIEARRSTIPQAGRGAFATRFLAKDEVITISPLIHALDSKILNMDHYEFNSETNFFTKVQSMPPQLVTNYCYAHNDSMLLLCPYGTGINYINHQNASLANVRIAWPKDDVLNHKSQWLDVPLSVWRPEDKKSVLAFEYIATRNISPGEELFIDYGPDWETAYAQHVQMWNPPAEYSDYLSATSWNQEHNRQDVLKAPEEQESEPNPPNLQLRCHGGLSSAWAYKYHALKWDNDPDKYNPEYGHECTILDRKEGSEGDITYRVLISEIIDDDEGNVNEYERRNVPRNCMKWFDKPESTDMHLEDVFRHSIGIPDDIFPNAWRIHPKEETTDEVEENLSKDNGEVSSANKELECGMYIANSTIPNSGLGLFTAYDIEKGHEVGNGDVAIMLTELDWHNSNGEEEDGYQEYFDMTGNYVWDGRTFGFGNEVTGAIHTFWPGINAAVNFNPFLVNLDNEAIPEFDDTGIHRYKNPGAGAFSPYHDGKSHAARSIPAGGELFKDYGPEWFHDRGQPYMPTIDDIQVAQNLLQSFFNTAGDQEAAYDLIMDIRKIWPSRLLNALPETYRDAAVGALGEIADVFQPNATKDIEWLKEHGRCMDHIVPGISTLPNAGHGAFAKRFIPKGTIVSGTPLIHIFEDVLEMYDLVYSNSSTGARKNPWTKSGHQLLLNYCFGHHESSLLLCPYGSGVNYVNHNSTMANVRIQWSPHGVTGHNSTWLSMAPKEMKWIFKQSLALDYVATEDIEEGAEIFLDYGPLWEIAWNEHLLSWTPKKRWSSYVSASTMNRLFGDDPLRTEVEQRDSPYPANLMLQCDRAILPDIEYDQFVPMNDVQSCLILERYNDDNGTDSYIVQMHLKGELEPEIHEIPREAIKFYDRPYTSDLHIRSAFRHRIGFPEGMFPMEWHDSKSSLIFANKAEQEMHERMRRARSDEL